MMWVMGGIGLLFGLCISAAMFVVPMDEIAKQARATLSPEQLSQLGSVDFEKFLKILYAVIGAILIVVSIVLLLLGTFVRRGGKGSVITGLVVFVALALFAVLGVLSGLAKAVTGEPAMILVAGFWLVLGAAFGLTLLWLLQALRSGDPRQSMQLYYAHLQQQQAYQPQTGYGYGYSAPAHGAPSPQGSLGMAPPPQESGQAMGNPQDPPPPHQ
jgi:ABC-type transport system involved in multi-copper enzyme maturation permease subunit